MTRTHRALVAALITAASLIGAGCGDDAPTSAKSTSSSSTDRSGTDREPGGGGSSTRAKGVRFAECMREHGIDDFPDPEASGELTIDGVVNGSSIDTEGQAWADAIGACKELQPSGFTGGQRTAAQQKVAIQFAQCIRDHGIPDFPDPEPDGPLIDTNRIPSAAGRGALDIPGFTETMDTCSGIYGDELGLKQP